MGFLDRLFHIGSLWKWLGVRTVMSRREYGEALKILKEISLPNGAKQIALVQVGNCYLHMGMRSEAVEAYSEAIASELTWGLRKDEEASRYIVTYAGFYSTVASHIEYTEGNSDDVELYEKLLQFRVSSNLKRTLPLPNRSAIRVGKRE